ATCATTDTRSAGSSDPVTTTPLDTEASLACTRSSVERSTVAASDSDSVAEVSPPHAASTDRAPMYTRTLAASRREVECMKIFVVSCGIGGVRPTESGDCGHSCWRFRLPAGE